MIKGGKGKRMYILTDGEKIKKNSYLATSIDIFPMKSETGSQDKNREWVRRRHKIVT